MHARNAGCIMTKDIPFAVTNAIAGLIEAMGMHAENQSYISTQQPPRYGIGDFLKVIEERGLGHNDLVKRILHSE